MCGTVALLTNTIVILFTFAMHAQVGIGDYKYIELHCVFPQVTQWIYSLGVELVMNVLTVPLTINLATQTQSINLHR